MQRRHIFVSALGLAMLTRAQTAKTTTVRVGGNVQARKLKYSVPPEYSPAAKAARIRGIVRLEVLIDKKGSVSQARVISGPSELTQSARDAVMQWKYETTEMRGELVEIITQVDVPLPPNAGRLPPAK